MKASDLLQAMLDAGAPIEAAMIALRALEAKDAEIAARDAEANNKRAKDAERKRISRASTDSPRTVTGCGADGSEQDKNPPQTPHKNSYTPVTPKGVTAPKGAVRNRGSKISEDWQLPAIAELGPKFRPLAEQWTKASYETEGAAFHSFWLAETGARAAKSCWKRAWENRIAQIHSKVMRDQKYGNAAPETGSIAPTDLAALQARRAELYRGLGRENEATGPPRSIGQVLGAAD